VSSILVFRQQHEKDDRITDYEMFDTNGDMLSIQILQQIEEDINNYHQQASSKLDIAWAWYIRVVVLW
jgi:hypothetical protein